jgi:adenosylcobinamide kinase / adenosylcobinamide-phosphate guanylyltransferase
MEKPSPVQPGGHLVLGGARSGKTAYALALADGSGLEKWMIATARAEDDEMAARIELHRKERGAEWRLVEEPLRIAEAIIDQARSDRILVIDCLTLWLSNLWFAEANIVLETAKLIEAVQALRGPAIFVSNEIGFGLAPETSLGRAFRDAQGRLNQDMAKMCSAATFVVAGMPIFLKNSN